MAQIRTVNIASHLCRMADLHPPMLAIAQPVEEHGQIRYVRLTYADLDQQSDEVAHGLMAAGIDRGTRVAVAVKPGLDLFVLTFALFKLAAVPVLIDPGIGVRNFGRCLERARPKAFIGTPTAHWVRRILRWGRSSIRTRITVGGRGGQSLQKLRSAGQAAMKAPRIVGSTTALEARSESVNAGSRIVAETLPADVAAILFTSGSTGPPKGVVYSHGNFDAQVRYLRESLDIEPGEVDLATFPLFALFAPALGMSAIIPLMDFTRPGRVDPRRIIDPIRQFSVSNMFGSPALIDRVGRYAEAEKITLPSLRRVISAGAPVQIPVVERFARLLSPEAQVHTPYGATEALPVACIGSNEILEQTRPLTEQGQGICVGQPVGDIEIRIIRISDEPIETWTDELLVDEGEIGEICVRGSVVTRKYFDQPEATQLAKILEPADDSSSAVTFWHRMGDLGRRDDQGRLWMCGRKSQRVRLPGGDLFTVPCEAVFNTHPRVRRSALVGVVRRGAMQPVICVELEQSGPWATMEADLRALAQTQPHTANIEHFLVHPRFPTDIRHNAKIGREKLAIWAAERLR